MTERIAYLCGEYPRATDTFIQREVEALRDAGQFVRTISVRRPAAIERPTVSPSPPENDTVYVLPISPWRLIAIHATQFARAPARYLSALHLAFTVRAPGLRSLAYQAFYFAEAAVVADLLRREGLVHIHNHAPDSSGYVAMIAAEMSGATFSMTIHGHGILAEPGRWRLTDKLERALFTVCVSWHARSQAMLWSNQETWPRLHMVHCGVSDVPRESRLHAGKGTRLVYVGRLDHVKGLPVLLDALERARETHPRILLDIVGDGPERESLERQATTRGLVDHVRFHGYLGQDDVQALLQQADVMVITSFTEGIPVALMEAMAAGVPVVAPRITGIPELVQNDCSGLLFAPANAEELASALKRVLDDPALRNRLAEAGRQVVREEFNLETESGRLVNLFRARLSGHPMPARPDPYLYTR